ncbi:copper-binding protein [Chitinimonas arctica]|nr:copper-binding protein [Chitinimonas arctica]
MIKPIFVAALLMTGAAIASGDAPALATGASATQALTDGEVRKVDPEQKKITIKHGEIANLGMPPMTMVFKVSDPALLASAKPGDKIRFSVEKRAEGFVVTSIQPADAAQ